MTRFAQATLLALSALGALPVLAAGPAEAAAKGGTVTACSRYGNGCYTAPVRPGQFGPVMRLKNGTWIDCKGSCKDTLREETVDYWDTLREKSGRR